MLMPPLGFSKALEKNLFTNEPLPFSVTLTLSPPEIVNPSGRDAATENALLILIVL